MGYAILWCLHLSSALFLTAGSCEVSSRRGRALWRRFWPVLTAAAAGLSVVPYAVVGAVLLSHNTRPKWLLAFGLTLFMAYSAGAVWILRSGLNGSGSGRSAARSWPKWGLISGLSFSLIGCFGVAALMENRIMIRTAVVNMNASDRLAGLMPANLPDRLNAGKLYEKAGQPLQKDRAALTWFTNVVDPDFDVAAGSVTQALADYRPSMALTRQAADRPGFSLDGNGTRFYDTPFPDYATFRDLASLFVMTARRKALQHNLEGAMADLRVVEKMADHLREYPLLISFMMGRALDRVRTDTLENVLAHAGRGTSDAALGPFILPDPVFPRYLRAMQVEGAGQLQGFAHLAATTDNIRQTVGGPADISLFNREATRFWRVFLLPADLESALTIAAHMGQAAGSYEEMAVNLQKIDDALAAGKFGIFTSMAAPGYDRYATSAKATDARRRLAVTALAVTAYRRQNGGYPSTLSSLVPGFLDQLPMDPFDPGNPIRMEAVDGGLDLFSTGPSRSVTSDAGGPIHFYVGKAAYEHFRLEPAGG